MRAPLALRAISPERGENSRFARQVPLMCLVFSPLGGSARRARGCIDLHENFRGSARRRNDQPSLKLRLAKHESYDSEAFDGETPCPSVLSVSPCLRG
jgi:hypothetical protein